DGSGEVEGGRRLSRCQRGGWRLWRPAGTRPGARARRRARRQGECRSGARALRRSDQERRDRRDRDPAPARQGEGRVMDLVIRGGTLLDGTGGAPRVADVAVKEGRIAQIGSVKANGPEIDATGLAVAPGFIDIHSHSDYTLLVDPRAVSAIAQGVTLEVIGNCGFGCAPIRDPQLAAPNIYGFDGRVPLGWTRIGQYLEKLEAAKPAVNVITLVPNGQLRRATLGVADRAANGAELEAMKALLAEGLDDGAWGYSTG